MPILPIIDLLILSGWTSLLLAFGVKAIYTTTSYRPQLFGLGPFDLVVVAAVLLLFALTLAARTWVKSYESQSTDIARRATAALEEFSAVQRNGNGDGKGDGNGDVPSMGDSRDGSRDDGVREVG